MTSTWLCLKWYMNSKEKYVSGFKDRYTKLKINKNVVLRNLRNTSFTAHGYITSDVDQDTYICITDPLFNHLPITLLNM